MDEGSLLQRLQHVRQRWQGLPSPLQAFYPAGRQSVGQSAVEALAVLNAWPAPQLPPALARYHNMPATYWLPSEHTQEAH